MAPTGKAVELRGRIGSRSEINGLYTPSRQFWGSFPAYCNYVSQVYLVRDPKLPRWMVVSQLEPSADVLAFAHGDCALPFKVPGPWFVAHSTHDGVYETDDAIKCVFCGQVVVVSGRAGHNSRLNGVFTELPMDFTNFPAYFDEVHHKYIYRHPEKPLWIISNRLGPSKRRSRGNVFAQVGDDCVTPYLVKEPWTICAWCGCPEEVDPSVSVLLQSEVCESPLQCVELQENVSTLVSLPAQVSLPLQSKEECSKATLPSSQLEQVNQLPAKESQHAAPAPEGCGHDSAKYRKAGSDPPGTPASVIARQLKAAARSLPSMGPGKSVLKVETKKPAPEPNEGNRHIVVGCIMFDMFKKLLDTLCKSHKAKVCLRGKVIDEQQYCADDLQRQLDDLKRQLGDLMPTTSSVRRANRNAQGVGRLQTIPETEPII
eukprot:gnl/MRDRNA2_/MRDRNA2_188884_c0_seq1.p1 gnl/MRDRNA2_/MRDRNA2_188884_c0~~gnl/MRDRNA2_/MRDRNA2_188884_c0_seq1.p1  ORF type:complete len:485 (+),score=55.03 gnl/MRDRNA2_/MRDRNA2_188884_c0_seq1:166-1455(+)